MIREKEDTCRLLNVIKAICQKTIFDLYPKKSYNVKNVFEVIV